MMGIMIVEKVVVKRPVMIVKKMSFKEAKERILDEAIKTEDVELIGALTLLLKTIERKRNG
jgi:hypothetical protein